VSSEHSLATEPPPARPTVVDAVLVMLVGVVLGGIASVILFFLLGALAWPVQEWSPLIVLSVGTVIVYAATLWAAHWFVVRGRGLSWQGIGLQRPDRNFVAMTFLAWFVTFISTIAVAYIVTILFGETPPAVNEQLGLGTRSLGVGEIAWLAMSSVVIAPVVEEIVFRGVLFDALRARWRFWTSAVISALLFGAVHFSLLTIPGLTVLGIALAWLRERYDSLYPPILLHALNNALAMTVLVFTTNAGA
jgi:membrane protease YdiL (CAAX protease family)